jgi:hypothetical protein
MESGDSFTGQRRGKAVSAAVYDNPATMCREAWHDGRMLAHISATLMYTKGFNGYPTLPFYLNVGRDFVPGRILGDRSALTVKSEP